MKFLYSIFFIVYTYLIQYIDFLYISSDSSDSSPIRSRNLRAIPVDPQCDSVKDILYEITNRYYNNINDMENIPILRPVKVYVETGINMKTYKMRIQEILPSSKCTYKIYTATESIPTKSKPKPKSKSKSKSGTTASAVSTAMSTSAAVSNIKDKYDFLDVEIQNVPCTVNKKLRGTF